MAKRSLIEQLNQIVETILTRPDYLSAPMEPELDALQQIAVRLRDIPSAEFKSRLKTELIRKRSMSKTSATIELYQGITPYICIKNAAEAIDFYKQAFGATEVMRFNQPDGRVAHAELKIGDSRIRIADEYPEYQLYSPQSLGGSPVRLHLYVENVDAFAQQAIDSGAKILRPVEDQFYGDRTGLLQDPFGYTWIVATHKKDVPFEEIQRYIDSMAKEEPQAVSPIREGFHTVTPYVIVREAAELIDFVKRAFGAEEMFRSIGSAGGIHAEVKVGDSILMMGGGGAWEGTPTPTSLHMYVENVDAVYAQALEAGGTSMYAPVDQVYGDREAGVTDLSGNHWYIATRQTGGHIPEGLHTVTPFLHPQNAPEFMQFLNRAFGAREISTTKSPEGRIAHAVIQMGTSALELGEAHGPYQPMPSTFFLYVENVDALYERSLRAGATSISKPADQPYGDRVGGVTDPFGNTWYLATHIKDSEG
jgi:PhnB protein